MLHHDRLTRLRNSLALLDRDLSALLVTDMTNILYLTGFSGSAGRLFVTTAGAVLVVDRRYEIQSAEQLARSGLSDDIELRVVKTYEWETLNDLIGRQHGRIGVEDRSLSWADARALADSCDAEIVPTFGLVEQLRTVKDASEQAAIAAAVALADGAFTEVLHTGWVGRTESELAMALEWEMRSLGASQVSFPTVVAAGPHGASPHARPSDAVIEADAPVVIDFGCVLLDYCSDTTRTVVWGSVPADVAEIHDVVVAAQDAARASVAAGVACKDVDAAARCVIEEAGYGDHFGHGVGHGVGLVVHESPRLGETSDATLVAGNVITLEPGIYVAGLGGVRVEDMVIVTGDGCRTLTGASRALEP